MSMWQQWVKKRRFAENFGGVDDSSAKFKFNTEDDDFADDYEHIQSELFKTVMTKYPDETMAFLNGIADRGDEEIASLLKKVRRDRGPSMAKEPSHPSDKDEVVPSSADTGYNPENGGGE